MNCDGAFFMDSGFGGCLGVYDDPRGARHWAHFRATDLYTVGSLDPDHDAVMRIGVGLQPTGLTRGEAPGGGPILSVGISARFEYGVSPPRIGNSAVVLKNQRKPRMVLSAMLVPASPFRTLDVRRRPPVVRQY